MADPKKLDKISKLRRLSRNNPDANESAKAKAKVEQLLKKNGITERELDEFDRRQQRVPVGVPQSPSPPPFSADFVVHVDPNSEFGRIFGFGFGFFVHVAPNTGATGTGSSSTTSWTQ